MAKQRKQKAVEAAAGACVVRHQKLCVALDVIQQRIYGHTELQVVAPKNGKIGLHARGLEILKVSVEGEFARFERSLSASEEPTEAKSISDAAEFVYKKYSAALQDSEQPDLFIFFPGATDEIQEPAPPATVQSEEPQAADLQQTGEAVNAAKPVEVLKLVQVHYALERSKSGAFFNGNVFHTYARLRHTNCWFPCVESISSRCSYHLEYTINSNYTAVSNGDLLCKVLCKEDPRLLTYVYSLDIPTCASAIALVVAPLVVLPEKKNASLSYMCLPGYLSQLQFSVSCFYSLFSLYEEYLGSAFPYGCYKQVFIASDGLISSIHASASMVTFSSHLLADERIIDQAILTQIKLAHALAQQWFGIFITPETTRDGWLVEGIAGFLVDLFVKRCLGNNEAQFRRYKASEAVTEADIDGAPSLSPASTHPSYLHETGKLGSLGKIRIWKAVAVVQMLEKQIGAESFRKILQRVILRALDPLRSIRSLSTKEFRHYANKIGNLERPFLKDFFPRWVESHGCPLLRMGFAYNKRRNLVEFAVHRDCTAVGASIPGKGEGKSIVEAGWPGMMSIRIHENDGMYDHPNLSMSGDVYQLLEIPCHSKLANRRPQRAKKGVDDSNDLISPADMKPSAESPLLWVRPDPGREYLAKIQLWQPEHMWINQLEKDRDVIAQLQAISALQQLPDSFSIVNALTTCLIDPKIFCRVRIEAAFALSSTASETTSWAGLGQLVKFYKARCFDPDIGLPKPNNFHDFSEYFVLEAIPLAVASVRGGNGKSPSEAVDFILSILKHNDNSGNAYSDAYWLSSVVDAVGELEVGQQSLPRFSRILKQIDRYLQYDRLMPSYNFILTQSCIRTLSRLGLKFAASLPLEPVEKLLMRSKNVEGAPWQIRVAALQSLINIKKHSHGLNAMLRSAVAFIYDDPCLKVQNKVMTHALKICIEECEGSCSEIEISTVALLMQLFESENCANNYLLRHNVFSVVQILGRRPATLLRMSKPQRPPEIQVPAALESTKEVINGGDLMEVRTNGGDETPKIKFKSPEPRIEPVKIRWHNTGGTGMSPASKKEGGEQKVGTLKLRLKTNLSFPPETPKALVAEQQPMREGEGEGAAGAGEGAGGNEGKGKGKGEGEGEVKGEDEERRKERKREKKEKKKEKKKHKKKHKDKDKDKEKHHKHKDKEHKHHHQVKSEDENQHLENRNLEGIFSSDKQLLMDVKKEGEGEGEGEGAGAGAGEGEASKRAGEGIIRLKIKRPKLDQQ